MRTDNELNSKVLYCVSYLQEFYDRRVMLRFFHACDEQECDIGEAFLFIANKLKTSIADGLTIPAFDEIAALYASSKGWIFDVRNLAVQGNGTTSV